VSLGDQFKQFLCQEWECDTAYTLTDIAIQLGDIDIRLARYYLMRAVDQGDLCRIKWHGSTWYLLAIWKEVFIELPFIRVL
jgi:hypothetical protein